MTTFFLALLFAIPAFAITRQWTGVVSANWSVPGNWYPAGVPSAADHLEFPGMSTSNDDPPEPVIFDLPPGTPVGSMSFLGDYHLSGNLMTLTGDLGFLSSPSAVAVTIDNDLRLGNSIRFNGPFRVTVNGGIDVNGHTLGMGTTFNTLLKGPLTGTGTLLIEPRGVALLGSGTFTGTLQGNAYVAGPYPSTTFISPWLTGTGTTAAASAGLLSPGEWLPGLYADPHTLGVMQTGSLSISSQYSVDIVPGASNDRVNVTGSVSVAGTLAVTIPSGTTPLPGSSFTIIDNDGSDAVSGTFSGLPEGAAFTVGSTQFVITYRGGDGNDVVLNAGGGVKTWIGYTSDKWSQASNWSPPVVPNSGEPLLFPTCCGSREQTTNDLPSFTAGLMSFHGSYTLGGNEITLTDNLQFAYGNNQLVYFVSNAPLKLANSIRFTPSTRQIYNGAIDVNGRTLTIETVDTMINGAINGTGAIIVTGPGLAVRSSGTFNGTINGIVDLAGAYPGATVTGTRVTGDGTFGAVTTDLLAPGLWHPTVPASNLIGTLQTGNLSIATKLAMNLAATGASDQVVVTGTVSIGGVLDVKMSGTAADGQTFVLIDNDGTDPISGTFTGLSEGATLNAGATTFRISYTGGTGNDVVLTAVPSGPAVKTWAGYISGLWSNKFNWSPDGVPVAGEPVLFPPNAPLSMTNDLPAGFTIGAMTFQNNYTLGGNALTLGGDVQLSSGIALQSNVDLKIGTALRVHASNATTFNGALDVNGQTLTLDTNQTSLRGPIAGSGSIVVNGPGVSIASSGSFSGTINGNADIVGAYPNATVTSPRLSGTGTLGAVSAGSLSPGSSSPCCADAHTVGTLKTGALSIASAFIVDLVSGGASDQVQVVGSVSLAGALQVSLTGSVAAGQSFKLIDNDGSDAVNGTFNGLPEGASVTVGATQLRISYQGGDGNDVVLSAASDRTTTTTLTQSKATSQRREPVTFTATVAASSGVPAGSVTFYDGATSIGSASLANGVAELTVSTLAVGTHEISAAYGGSATHDASTSAAVTHTVVKRNATVGITSSSPTATYGTLVSFAIVVTGSDSLVPTGSVTLSVADVVTLTAPLATDGTATFTVPLLPAGTHLVTVSYSGDDTFAPATNSITQTVSKALTAIALATIANPSPIGVPVTVAVEVNPVAHPTMPVSGDVVVASGENVAEAQLIANAAVVRVGPFRGGEYTITATYAGDANYETATATLTQRIAQPAVLVTQTSRDEGSDGFDETVRVELTEASPWPVTVDYRTVGGTATPNVDYVEAQGTLLFNPGQTSATIPIRILGDSVIEPDEMFEIQLTNVAGAALVEERIPFVIANDDQSYRAAVAHAIATNDGAIVRGTFYAPASGNGPWPVIVWVPGNTAYDGAGGEIAALRETARGYAVLSVGYRAPSAAPFPAQIHDLQAAVRWLRANAMTLEIDPNRIAAWGAGAGGHLATLLGTGLADTDADARVNAVVAWSPIADLTSLQSDASRCSTTNWNASSSPASQLIGCALPQCAAAAEAASPARYANRGDAPVLLMHGRADCFVAPRQSERLYDALARAGVDATLRVIDFVGHDDAYWTSAAAFAEAGAFLDAKLKPRVGKRRSARR